MKSLFKSSFIFIFFTVAIFSSCKKEKVEKASPEDLQLAADFDASLQGNQYRLAKYYSPSPIDYNVEDDVVKAETDLWPYVSFWITDDLNEFNSSTKMVTVIQGDRKIADNNAASFSKPYKISADKEGVYLDFLTYKYDPLTYRLVSFNDSSFIVSAKWGSADKVVSEFVVVK